MEPRRRDGLLAAVALVALATGGLATGGLRVFTDLPAAAVGVGGALAAEVLFLRYPGLLLAAWDKRWVPVAATAALVAVGGAALAVAPWLVGAACWGLGMYLALLGYVAATGHNPLAPVAGR